jgi:hypothetical protein
MSPRDLAPWRLRTRDGHSQPPVTHKVVYQPGWQIIGNLYAPASQPRPAAAVPPPSAPPRPAQPRALALDPHRAVRVFVAGDPLPQNLRAAMDRHGDVWTARDWDGSLIDWADLLHLYAPLVEVPTAWLLSQLQAATQTGRS